MANLSWIGNSGDWYNPTNWSTGVVPGSGDDVTINRPGINLTITFSQGNPNVRSLSLLALNGSVLALSGLTSYTGPTLNLSPTIEANGAGSRIDLSSLKTLTGTTGLSGTVNFNAKDGGVLDLSSLTQTPTGRIALLADGTNSVVVTSSLTSFGNSTYASSLIARNGGTVKADNLTSLQRVTLPLVSSGNFRTSQITSATDSSITVDSITPDFSKLSNIDRSNLTVNNGGSLVLPAVISYTGPTNNVSPVIEASGTGSRIDLSSLTTLTGTTGIVGAVNLNAKGGGVLDLSEINRVFGGRVSVLSDGSNSVVELSKLATNSFVTLNQQNGGSIAIVEPTDLENLGIIGGSSTISDSVGSLDPADLYRFQLNTASNLGFLLTQVGDSVSKAEILDSNGNLLTSIVPSGSEELPAGTYYLWVYKPVGLTNYNLELSTAGTVDGAGNTLDTARNLGILTGTQTINGSVGNADPKDLFRFQLTNSSNFSLLLNGLTADADVQLLDSGGNFIASSSKGGTASESLTKKLDSGVYYVEIDNHSGNTGYNLQLTSTLATVTPFQIASFTPDYGSNVGNTTITVVGNQFTPNATLSLIDANGVERLAHQTVWYNDTTLVGTFDRKTAAQAPAFKRGEKRQGNLFPVN